MEKDQDEALEIVGFRPTGAAKSSERAARSVSRIDVFLFCFEGVPSEKWLGAHSSRYREDAAHLWEMAKTLRDSAMLRASNLGLAIAFGRLVVRERARTPEQLTIRGSAEGS